MLCLDLHGPKTAKNSMEKLSISKLILSVKNRFLQLKPFFPTARQQPAPVTRALQDPTEARAHLAVLALSKHVREPQHAIHVRQTPTRPWEASLPQPAPVTRALQDPTGARVRCVSPESTRRWQDPNHASTAGPAHILRLSVLQLARPVLTIPHRQSPVPRRARASATRDTQGPTGDHVNSARQILTG